MVRRRHAAVSIHHDTVDADPLRCSSIVLPVRSYRPWKRDESRLSSPVSCSSLTACGDPATLPILIA